MSTQDSMGTRPHLSTLAIVSFILSFLIARAFTTFSPNIVLVSGNIHIHHFWYGLALLVLGGWLGISYENERINRLAATLFGAGGGLVGDEVGLLLTFGDYWTGITYTFVIVFLAFVSVLALLNAYRKVVIREFAHFVGSSAAFYVGLILVVVSTAFAVETENATIGLASRLLTIVASLLILAYFINRRRRGLRKSRDKP